MEAYDEIDHVKDKIAYIVEKQYECGLYTSYDYLEYKANYNRVIGKLEKQKNHAEYILLLESAARDYQELYEMNPYSNKFRNDYRYLCYDLILFYRGKNDNEKALYWAHKDEEIELNMWRLNSDNIECMKNYGDICNMLAILCNIDNNFTEAEKWFLKVEEIYKKLYDDSQNDLVKAHKYTYVCHSLGDINKNMQRTNKAIEWYLLANEIEQHILNSDSNNVQLLFDYSETTFQLGNIYLEKDNLSECIRWFLISFESSNKLYQMDTNNKEYRERISKKYMALILAYQKNGDEENTKKWLSGYQEYINLANI